jgi:secreted trypsin-like serine protease
VALLKKFKLFVAALAMFIIPLMGVAAPARAATPLNVHPNIVGGTNASQQYGAISLWNSNRSRCTAVLIDRYWALTAAHCSDLLTPDQVTEVRASSLDNTSGYEEVGIDSFYTHPNYDANYLKNDLTLIKFKRPVKKINSKPLEIYGKTPTAKDQLKVAGWGWICEDTTNPSCAHPVNILQELDMKIAPATSCPAMWDPANELCGIAANGTHANGCYGDSGGPLVVRSDNKWKLAGITSYDGDDWTTNSGCGNSPSGGQGSGVFVNVSKYKAWIKQTMEAHC